MAQEGNSTNTRRFLLLLLPRLRGGRGSGRDAAIISTLNRARPREFIIRLLGHCFVGSVVEERGVFRLMVTAHLHRLQERAARRVISSSFTAPRSSSLSPQSIGSSITKTLGCYPFSLQGLGEGYQTQTKNRKERFDTLEPGPSRAIDSVLVFNLNVKPPTTNQLGVTTISSTTTLRRLNKYALF